MFISLRVFSFGSTSAIDASFIALGLHIYFLIDCLFVLFLLFVSLLTPPRLLHHILLSP